MSWITINEDALEEKRMGLSETYGEVRIDADLTAALGLEGVRVYRCHGGGNPKYHRGYACVHTHRNQVGYVLGHDIIMSEDFPYNKIGVLMHEKGHLVHKDYEQRSGSDVHARRVPVLSEAYADRYACQQGYGKEILAALRKRYWELLLTGRPLNDIPARIKLIKRYIKKHSK